MSMRAELQQVRLYGEMGRRFGRVHWYALDSGTPAEAIAALKANYPETEPYFMQAKDRGIGFAVFRGRQNLKADELHSNIGDGPIRIAPIILGSKNGGILEVIIGVVLLALAVFDYGVTSPEGEAFLAAGLGMVASGVVSLLTPMPKGATAKDAAANQASYAFSGPVNTQAQGNPVPVLYGEMIVGSAVISAGIQAEDTVATQGATSGAHGGMGGGGKLINRVPI
jgi:predicted phage tail protein